MFDIGFTEILLIAVVSLIVIGPKRLPETIRFLGYWVGKLRRSVQGARQEMEREFGLDEIRRELYNEELLSRMEDERKQIAKRLGSPPSQLNTPTPANLKTPAEEDFIDEEPEGSPTESANDLTARAKPSSVSNDQTTPETPTNKPT